MINGAARAGVDEKAHARQTGGEKLQLGRRLLEGELNGEGHSNET
jgi:hypothetical protein